MSTSGTYAFALAADDCLTEAWERCGKSPHVLNGDVARSARRSLQLLLIHWTNLRVPLWQVEQVVTTLAKGQASFVLPAEVADVLDCYVSSGGIDRPLGRVGRADYAAIGAKTVQGPPSQLWIQRVLPQSIATFYPVPDQTYVFVAWCLRQPQDLAAMYQTPEAPVLWAEALCAGLAAALAVKFAPERVSLLQPLADAAFTAASVENRERAPFSLLPDMG